MPLGVATGKRMYVVALCNLDRDKCALVEIDMETGNEVEVIYSHPDVDIDHGGYSSDRGEMAYATYATWKQQRHLLDRKTEQVYGAIGKKLAGYEIDILDRDTRSEEHKYELQLIMRISYAVFCLTKKK